MKTALDKPDWSCWLSGLVLVMVGLLMGPYTVDVQLHDTYLVIATKYIVLAGAALLLLLGTGYWVLKLAGKTPRRNLTRIHLLLTTGVFLVFALHLFLDDRAVGAGWILLSIVIFLIAQCIYAANFLLTLLRK